MTEEDRARVRGAQAEAWRSISSAFSVYELTTDQVSKDMWLKLLIKSVNEKKKKISKLIDSLPD